MQRTLPQRCLTSVERETGADEKSIAFPNVTRIYAEACVDTMTDETRHFLDQGTGELLVEVQLEETSG